MIHVYTGTGKGKTTAALGLAVRAAGAGLPVYIAQFLKCGPYSEVKALKKIKKIKIEQFGRRCFIKRKPTLKDILAAQKGLQKAKKIILSRKYKLVILDEINVAIYFKLVTLDDLLNLLRICPIKTELVLTGRRAHPKVIAVADLVSDIREVKHYFSCGVKARKGIES